MEDTISLMHVLSPSPLPLPQALGRMIWGRVQVGLGALGPYYGWNRRSDLMFHALTSFLPFSSFSLKVPG